MPHFLRRCLLTSMLSATTSYSLGGELFEQTLTNQLASRSALAHYDSDLLPCVESGEPPCPQFGDAAEDPAACEAEVGCGDACGDSGVGRAAGDKKKPKVDPCTKSHAGVFYANDFSYLKDPAYKGHCLGDDWKLMPVGPCGEYGTLDVGGQQRFRYMHERGMGNEVGTPLGFRRTDNDYLLSRTRLYTNWKVNDDIRFFQEGIFAYVDDWQSDYTPRIIDRNSADYLNFFVDAKMTDHTTLRIGRQELNYGNQRLVSPLDWANTRRTFEGIKAMYKNDDLAIDTFFTNYVPVNPYDFDEADYQQRFYGSYLVFTESESRTWDLYYLGYDNDNPASQVAGQRDFSLHTIGARVNGKKEVWLYEAEGGGQFGRQSGLGVDHSAAFGTIGLGKELGLTWSPTLWLYYDYASGNVPGGDFNRFNHLFPLGHKYIGFIDSAQRSNISSPNALLTMKPNKKTELLFWYHYIGANQAEDIIPGVGFQSAQNTTSKDFGNELDLIAKYNFSARQSALIGYSHLWRGNKIIGDTDINFTYLEWQLNF